jgi:drug/metabolite transporter (DMT)-like permease
VAVLLSLLASLTWGTADFLGGTAARRLAPTAVVAVSQGAALIGLLVVGAAISGFTADAGYLGWAIAAALTGVVALTAFYSALASGRMGVVAPIAALGVAVPVIVGLASGERPTALQGVGVVAAVLGVILASGPELRSGLGARRPLLLAAVAAAGFGTVIVCVSRGARTSTLMTLLVMRAVSVSVMLLLGALGRVRVAAERQDLPILLAVGIGDVSANAMFAVASTKGQLSIVAVLSSLYPAITVLLARLVHDERLRRVQAFGVVATLAGVVLIASGPAG